jgi:hypothetical protein
MEAAPRQVVAVVAFVIVVLAEVCHLSVSIAPIIVVGC